MPEEDPTDEPKGAPELGAAGKAGGSPEEPARLENALERPEDQGALEAYHQRARLAEDRLAEVLAAYRKIKIETEGHRERTTKNIERRFEQRRERLLLKFIDILDNLDRALEAAEASFAGEPMIEGLILVRTQLLQTLQEEGLERIPALGRPYDPNFSEAVETREVEDPDQHHVVVKELLRGYRLNGKVARASRVVVGEFPGAENAAEEAAAEPEAPAPEPEIEAAEPGAPPGEPTLDEIIQRAQAQEALFPDAFGDEEKK